MDLNSTRVSVLALQTCAVIVVGNNVSVGEVSEACHKRLIVKVCRSPVPFHHLKVEDEERAFGVPLRLQGGR
jgi:hypothetical protein